MLQGGRSRKARNDHDAGLKHVSTNAPSPAWIPRFIEGKESGAILFRLRTAQVFDLAAAMFALQPPFPGRTRGPCPFADFGLFGRLPDQAHQAGNGVLAVLFLGAEPPGIDDQMPFFGHPLSAQPGKTFPNIFGQGRRMGHIEAELNGSGDLIDILPARPGGADELLMNFFLSDRDRLRNSNHTFSVRRVGFSGKRRFSLPGWGILFNPFFQNSIKKGGRQGCFSEEARNVDSRRRRDL
jgi:hypothetical protein